MFELREGDRVVNISVALDNSSIEALMFDREVMTHICSPAAVAIIDTILAADLHGDLLNFGEKIY